MNTITSYNSVVMLAIQSVFPTPQQISSFAVDQAFDTEMSESSIVQTGVDGFGVAGYVPREVKQTYTLLASSTSFILFEQWILAMDALGDVLYASASIAIPSIGRKYTCAQGSLTRYPSLPNARRVLEQRQFEITWMPPGFGIPAIVGGPL
jgi:hypothetical protein